MQAVTRISKMKEKPFKFKAAQLGINKDYFEEEPISGRKIDGKSWFQRLAQ